jgi:hypothetical protein
MKKEQKVDGSNIPKKTPHRGNQNDEQERVEVETTSEDDEYTNAELNSKCPSSFSYHEC